LSPDGVVSSVGVRLRRRSVVHRGVTGVTDGVLVADKKVLVGEPIGQQLTDCESFALEYADTDKRIVWHMDEVTYKGTNVVTFSGLW